MFDSLLKDLASPHAAAQVIMVLLALFARDVAVGLLRSYQRRTKEDKDPSNDAAGDAAGVIADGIEKISLKKRP